MFGPAITLLMIAACVTTQSAAAQAPLPTTTFDGTYAGVSGVATRWEPGRNNYCRQPGVPSPLMIEGGVIQSTGGDGWHGTVNHQGDLVIRNLRGRRVNGHIDPSGTVTGYSPGPTCKTRFVWRKQPG